MIVGLDKTHPLRILRYFIIPQKRLSLRTFTYMQIDKVVLNLDDLQNNFSFKPIKVWQRRSLYFALPKIIQKNEGFVVV